jgi:hypothetical protein
MSTEAKKYLISLAPEDVAKLEALADTHGRTPTGMITYLIRVQLGTLPEVQPVRAQPLTATERIPTKEARPVAPAKDTQPEHTEEQTGKSALIAARPKEHRTEAPTKDRTQGTDKAPEQEAPISKNAAEYTERIGSGIYSNGTHYTLNKFGKRTFYRTLQEAQKAAQ